MDTFIFRRCSRIPSPWVGARLSDLLLIRTVRQKHGRDFRGQAINRLKFPPYSFLSDGSLTVGKMAQPLGEGSQESHQSQASSRLRKLRLGQHVTPVPETPGQNRQAQPFSNSWSAETVRDNKVSCWIKPLSFEAICCTAVDKWGIILLPLPLSRLPVLRPNWSIHCSKLHIFPEYLLWANPGQTLAMWQWAS